MKIFVKILIFSLLLGPVCVNADNLKELYSDHFIIVSDKSIDQEYVYKMKDIAEYYYKTITQELNFVRDKPWLWRNRATIFVAKDRQDYIKKYTCPEWSNACVNYQNKAIFTYPQQEDFSSILSHELTHIIFREYIGKEQLPLWLDEGMSVYMDHVYGKVKGNEKFILMKQLINSGKYIKISELNSMTLIELKTKPKEYVEMFYLESFSVIYFLVKKWSRYNLSNFFKFLKDGYTISEALCKSYDLRTLEDLEKQWIRFYQI